MKTIPFFASLVFALFVLFTFQSHAQENKIFEPALVINGVPIDNGIRTINGKTYLDLDAISKALE